MLAAIFKECGIALSQRQTEQLWLYHGLLRHHNTTLNLTRIHNFTNMVLKLYVDSVLPATLITLPSPLMDLGSGPGMPGIPLKILQPELDMVLAEGRAKRVTFLQEVVDQLGLTGIEVVDRNITPAFDRPVNGVITRAVEQIDQTLERVRGCLNKEGRMIFMKGPGCGPEVETALQRFDRQYALETDRSYRIGHTGNERRLVVFRRLDEPTRVIADRAARRHRVHELTSEQNSRYKQLKKLLTGRGLKKNDQAIVSGVRPIRELLARHPQRCLAWITSGADQPPPVDAPERMVWLQLSDPLYQSLDLFGTRSPLLLFEPPAITPWSPAEGFPPGCTLLAPFQDPENIGTVIRSAAAFGVTQVVLLAESAHPYHPKALRAAGGTTPNVTLRQGPSIKALPEDLPVVPLSAEGEDLSTVTFPPAFGLLIGLEGEGLPGRWRQAAVRIPIDPAVESLNAATAAAIALFAWRQRETMHTSL